MQNRHHHGRDADRPRAQEKPEQRKDVRRPENENEKPKRPVPDDKNRK